MGGDGDLASIGGNHLIHAARRNLDMTVICANNRVYGMTGGQVTPTTPLGARTATTPEGNPDLPFDLCRLVAAAGATYVARHSVYHIRPLIRILKRALQHKGFAFVEVLSPCPTQYGRRNDLETPTAMLRNLKDTCITLKEAEGMSEDALWGKVVVGEVLDSFV
ncbi:MAG: thiamine pyrophosphate-dependent enzyme [Dehalococcoidia bacterium]